MIRLKAVNKVYRQGGLFSRQKETQALKDLTLDIEPGGFGLLGGNGAGKTTTTKMMATLLHPTSGSIEVGGMNVVSQAKQVRHRVNMITGSDRMLYFRLTGRENLRYFAALYGLSGSQATSRIDQLLEFVELTEAGDERVERYSRGMKQRLSIARGLINDPDYLFLDEPTLGLDVSIAADIRSFIRQRLLSDTRRTVVLTSHYMKEVEELCPQIAILNRGSLLYHGDPLSLATTLGLVPRHNFSFVPASQQQLSSIRSDINLENELEDLGAGRVMLTIRSDDNIAAGVISQLNSRGISDIDYRNQSFGLEDALITLSKQEVAV